jgi:beta-glucuronidase
VPISAPPRILLAALLAALLLAAPAAAPAGAQISYPGPGDEPPPAESEPDPGQDGETPSEGALYETGPDGRYLLGGQWLHRLDPGDTGLREGFAHASSTESWRDVTVPHVWNARDLTEESMLGSVGWYRKDFRLPDDPQARGWVVRFEAANYRLTAWLNGKPIGRHEGSFLPFELPLAGLREGTNRLVVRVDSRTNQFDLPPGGPDDTGRPDGGWWNYGGLPREVYLRRVGAVEVEDVNVVSRVRCRTCEANVEVEARVRNHTSSSRPVDLGGGFGRSGLRFTGPARLAGGQAATYRARLRIEEPSLWSPLAPSLYRVNVLARSAGAEARWFARHGIRTIRVAKGGRLLLNGRPVALRGASLHEDDPQAGNALDSARRRADVELLRRLGATITRSHYPLHQEFLELCDEFGILVWDQAPVYQLREPQLASAAIRKRAVGLIRRQVVRDRSHASVLAYSLVNELPARPGSGHELLIERMAAAVRKLDPTRLVALDILGYPQVGPQEAYRFVDAIGINDYFGWYPGPNGTTIDRENLGPYLDRLHSAYPDQALFITEFGAEANRSGPLDEKGTYAFQRDFLRYHLDVFDARPFINGALVWILRDFRVKPGWEGGNPKPEPPVNFKGLVTQDGATKPAFDELARLFRATRQVR